MKIEIGRKDLEEIAALCREESRRITVELVCNERMTGSEREALRKREAACRHLLTALTDTELQTAREADVRMGVAAGLRRARV